MAESSRLIGYVPAFEFGCGSAVAVHVHGDGLPVQVDLVRLDEGTAGDGVPGTAQTLGSIPPYGIATGSWAEAPGRRLSDDVTISVAVQLSAWPAVSAGLIGAGGDDAGWAVEVLSDRRVRLRVRAGEQVVDAALAGSDLQGSWHRVTVELSPAGAELRIGSRSVRVSTHLASGVAGESILWTLARTPWPPDRTLGEHTFDGKLADVELCWEGPEGSVIRQAWDFAAEPHSADVAATTPETSPFTLHQAPTRAVTGPAWTGKVHHWADSPAQWNAIHFHHDDLEDAEWPVATTVQLARELPAGLYAARLRTERHSDLVPFVVRGRAGARRSPVRLLLPTMTYLAYANEPIFAPHVPLHRGWWDEWADHLGLLSLYNWHADGSGVSLASARRPLLNMRPDYRYWLTGCAHGLGLDLRLLRWLRAIDVDVEVLTDHRLDANPAETLEGAEVLITGSHPEYWTRRMMDALETFLHRGGRLIYLGGNGFAANVGVHADRPHLLELRRRGNGPGLWDAAAGELGLASTAEVGGYWRHLKPTTRSLTGLDSAGMGFAPGVAYHRTDASDEDANSFVFAGVEGRVFGRSSAVLGAAAGYEVDSADPLRGTPPDTKVLATATGFGPEYVGLEQSGQVRSDVVLRVLPSGGAVFGVGSIAWCGSLGDDDDADPDVARITENVLRRFADPKPLG